MKKLLQKRILIPILVGLAVVICIVTAVCVFVGKEGKTMNENPETDEPVSESVSEPITEPATEASAETPTESGPTEPPTEAPTEPPTEPEAPKLAINYDLLDDIGLSCTELEEKRGAITSYTSPHGGLGYKYENGYGTYCFADKPFVKRYYDDSDACPKFDDHLWKDESGCFVKIATAEEGCSGIEYIDGHDALLNASDIVSVAEIEAIDGVTAYCASVYESEMTGSYKYYSKFSVDGYDNYYVVFYHDDPNLIDLNSYKVSIMPPPNF